MNPARPPIPPCPTRTRTNDAGPNSLYGVHINAAGAYNSSAGAHRTHPRSNTSPSSVYPAHISQHYATPPPALPLGIPALRDAPPLPPSLMPGGARPRSELRRSFESSLFFQTSPSPLPSSAASPTGVNIHPYAHTPSRSPKPPLPPKPHLRTYPSDEHFSERAAPKIPPKNFTVPGQPHFPITIPKGTASPEDSDELLARVLELSLKDTGRTVSQHELEDEILARVLEESMMSFSSTNLRNAGTRHATAPQILATNASAESLSASSSSPPLTSSSYGFAETPASSYFSPSLEADYVHKQWHVSGEGDLDQQEQGLVNLDDEVRRTQADEGLARSITCNEASKTLVSPTHTSLDPSSSESISGAHSVLPTNTGRPFSSSAFSTFQPPLPTSHTPVSLASTDAGSHPPLPKGAGSARSFGSVGVDATVTPTLDRLGRSASTQAAFSSVIAGDTNPGSIAVEPIRSSMIPTDTRPNTMIPVQRAQTSSSPETSPITPKVKPKLVIKGLTRVIASGSIIGSTQPIEEAAESEELGNDLSPISTAGSVDNRDEVELTSRLSSALLVERELLMGVSFGFNSPLMTLTHTPMQGPIPNIISLPYGRCPPLHIQAPSWKQLLKLLTRLSESRIEPTVEALAGTRSEFKLRTVVQFVRLQHSSSDWRTIVYLTIDVPVPPQTPNAFKYTNGDVNTFPASYINSPLPALLRSGAGDSDLAKCFTVPSTVNTPYPTLPMALPDYAMYLHAVLEDSRHAANDTSSGLRRLAKMVDGFYPAAANAGEGLGPEVGLPDRRGVGGFFRRALGRAEKNNQSQRGGNADTYEFITPFRIDEYR